MSSYTTSQSECIATAPLGADGATPGVPTGGAGTDFGTFDLSTDCELPSGTKSLREIIRCTASLLSFTRIVPSDDQARLMHSAFNSRRAS